MSVQSTQTATVGQVVLSPLAVIRRATRDLLAQAGAGEPVAIPEVKRAVIHLLAASPTDLQAWLDETVGPVVYDEVQRIVGNTRSGVVMFGDLIATPEQVKQVATQRRARWQLFLEHAGARHVRVMDMTADDLRLAASERRQRGLQELRYAALWESLAARLGPSQRVSDVFTADQIDQLAQRLHVEVVATETTAIPTALAAD